MKNRILHEHTFGNTAAAVNLADLLNKHPRLNRKVSSSMLHLNTRLNEIIASNLSSALKRWAIKGIWADFVKSINNGYIDVELVRTHALNVGKANYLQRLVLVEK